VCILLGYDSPILLRMGHLGMWQVVGECYVHSLADLTGIMGPLPENWAEEVVWDSTGLQVHRYSNSLTGIVTSEDPRFDPLPPHWEKAYNDRTPDDPEIFEWFMNKTTEEKINSDPRLLPSALQARGISLTTFQLI
jgi:hypothetical protein